MAFRLCLDLRDCACKVWEERVVDGWRQGAARLERVAEHSGTFRSLSALQDGCLSLSKIRVSIEEICAFESGGRKVLRNDAR